MRRSIIPLAAALGPSPAVAASPELWATTTASTDIADGVEAELELVARFSDDAGGLYEIEAGGSIAVELSDSVTVSAGYLRVLGYEDGEVRSRENRFRQQVVVDLGRLGGGALQARGRVEQRLREGGDDLGWRLRTQVAWTRPFRGDDGPALRLWHESFWGLNDTDWGQDGGYNRSRSFIGVRLPLGSGARTELGYIHQYDVEDGAADEVAHAFSASLAFDF